MKCRLQVLWAGTLLMTLLVVFRAVFFNDTSFQALEVVVDGGEQGQGQQQQHYEAAADYGTKKNKRKKKSRRRGTMVMNVQADDTTPYAPDYTCPEVLLLRLRNTLSLGGGLRLLGDDHDDEYDYVALAPATAATTTHNKYIKDIVSSQRLISLPEADTFFDDYFYQQHHDEFVFDFENSSSDDDVIDTDVTDDDDGDDDAVTVVRRPHRRPLLNLNPNPPPLRIACLGDSNTRGQLFVDEGADYPQVLLRLILRLQQQQQRYMRHSRRKIISGNEKKPEKYQQQRQGQDTQKKKKAMPMSMQMQIQSSENEYHGVGGEEGSGGGDHLLRWLLSDMSSSRSNKKITKNKREWEGEERYSNEAYLQDYFHFNKFRNTEEYRFKKKQTFQQIERKEETRELSKSKVPLPLLLLPVRYSITEVQGPYVTIERRKKKGKRGKRKGKKSLQAPAKWRRAKIYRSSGFGKGVGIRFGHRLLGGSGRGNGGSGSIILDINNSSGSGSNSSISSTSSTSKNSNISSSAAFEQQQQQGFGSVEVVNFGHGGSMASIPKTIDMKPETTKIATMVEAVVGKDKVTGEVGGTAVGNKTTNSLPNAAAAGVPAPIPVPAPVPVVHTRMMTGDGKVVELTLPYYGQTPSGIAAGKYANRGGGGGGSQKKYADVMAVTTAVGGDKTQVQDQIQPSSSGGGIGTGSEIRGGGSDSSDTSSTGRNDKSSVPRTPPTGGGLNLPASASTTSAQPPSYGHYPHIVTVMLGTNDVWGGWRGPEAYRDGIQKILMENYLVLPPSPPPPPPPPEPQLQKSPSSDSGSSSSSNNNNSSETYAESTTKRNGQSKPKPQPKPHIIILVTPPPSFGQRPLSTSTSSATANTNTPSITPEAQKPTRRGEKELSWGSLQYERQHRDVRLVLASLVAHHNNLRREWQQKNQREKQQKNKQKNHRKEQPKKRHHRGQKDPEEGEEYFHQQQHQHHQYQDQLLLLADVWSPVMHLLRQLVPRFAEKNRKYNSNFFSHSLAGGDLTWGEDVMASGLYVDNLHLSARAHQIVANTILATLCTAAAPEDVGISDSTTTAAAAGKMQKEEEEDEREQEKWKEGQQQRQWWSLSDRSLRVIEEEFNVSLPVYGFTQNIR